MDKYTTTKTISNKNEKIPNTVGRRGEIDRSPQEFGNKYKNVLKKQNSVIRSRFDLATLNARSLKSQESLLELENALKSINWDIIGLSEVRRSEEKIEEHEDYIFYYKNISAGLYGVGFMVKKYLKNEILEFIGVSDRIAILNIKLPGHKQPISVVQVYAPTNIAKEEVKNNFYKKLNEVIPNLHKTIIVIGDFNGQLGKRRSNEDKILGLYSSGKRNDNGQRLINFGLENNLKIMNTYSKKPNRKWTWISEWSDEKRN